MDKDRMSSSIRTACAVISTMIACVLFSGQAEQRFRKQYINTISMDNATDPQEKLFDDTFSEVNTTRYNETEVGATKVLSHTIASINFGSITNADFVYIKADQLVSVVFNGANLEYVLHPNQPAVMHFSITSVSINNISSTDTTVRYVLSGRN